MTLVDATARATIATDIGRTLFVEAGAGTGKTTALVRRVGSLVSTGHLDDVRGLTAITFTENAAAQLRSRVREQLERGAADEARPEVERARCEVALTRLDDAALTTLHGFAARLLADHPLEAGLPPGFGVRDAVAATLEQDRWWTAWVDEVLDDDSLVETWRTAMTLGLAPSALRPVADALAGSYDRLQPLDPGPPVLPAWNLEPVLAELQRAVASWADAGPEDDGLTDHLRTGIRPALADLALEEDDLGRAAVLTSTRITCSGGRKNDWRKAGFDKAEVTAALSAAAEQFAGQLAAVRGAVLDRLLARLVDAVLVEARRRREEGRLHFHDLLVLARKLLDDDAVRRQLHARWPVILVDEFQDTDPLQDELVHRIAGRPGEDGVDAGRLFFVGDPKQSIYRFRRAEVRLYEQVKDRYGDGLTALVQNFRSRPQIVSVVNAAFDRLLPDAAAECEQVGWSALAAARPPASAGGPAVLLLGGPHSERAMFDVRQAEASHVATTARRARDEGWRVRVDHDSENTRPARFADVAILVPTRTSVAQLEDALQELDVPYRIESRSLVWQTDAVRDLLTTLEAIDDAGDEVALVTALRHPGFACSDDDLVSWKAGGGRWSYLSTVPDGLESSPVASAMAALRGFHDRRWWVPVNQLVDAVIRERRLVELTTALPRPRDHWRRLRFVVDQARAFLDGGGAGLGEFVRWAREQADSGADAIETVLPEPDDDAVRILTIHAAKGLEFPVVILSGLNVEETWTYKVLWEGGRPLVKVGDFVSAGWGGAAAQEKRLDLGETFRTLYVGLTRAEDHLVVSAHHKAPSDPDKPKSHAGRLWKHRDALVAAGAEVEEAAGECVPRDLGAEPSSADGDPVTSRRAFLDGQADLRRRVFSELPTTATALARAGRASDERLAPVPESPDDDERADDLVAAQPDGGEAADRPVIRTRSASGASIGTAVHRVLELVDFADWTDEGVEALSRQAASAAGVPALAGQVAQRVRSALRSPLLQAAAERRHWKEVFVSARIDGRHVEGFVDLLVEEPDGSVTVVDYKTDRVDDEAALAAKVQQYAPQLRAYALAVSSATGRPVSGTALLFCQPTTAVEHRLG